MLKTIRHKIWTDLCYTGKNVMGNEKKDYPVFRQFKIPDIIPDQSCSGIILSLDPSLSRLSDLMEIIKPGETWLVDQLISHGDGNRFLLIRNHGSDLTKRRYKPNPNVRYQSSILCGHTLKSRHSSILSNEREQHYIHLSDTTPLPSDIQPNDEEKTDQDTETQPKNESENESLNTKRGKSRKKAIKLYVSETHYEKLHESARKMDMSLSQYIMRILRRDTLTA